MNKPELILIFAAVIFGVISAAYFYKSSEIFARLLEKQLKMIAGGMFIIAIGVLLAAFISYESGLGVGPLNFIGIPLPVFFYVLYLVGSTMIAFGARNFTKRSKPVVSSV